MKFSSISKEFFKLCSFDTEVLQKGERRPYLIILKFTFDGKKQDFAIPLRSNIPKHVPKELYFSLPPRPNTKKNHVHGLHYIKMFPVKKEHLEKYHIDTEHQRILGIVNKHKKKIINDAQRYLDNYQNGKRYKFSTDINAIYLAIHGVQTIQQEAALSENDNFEK